MILNITDNDLDGFASNLAISIAYSSVETIIAGPHSDENVEKILKGLVNACPFHSIYITDMTLSEDGIKTALDLISSGVKVRVFDHHPNPEALGHEWYLLDESQCSASLVAESLGVYGGRFKRFFDLVKTYDLFLDDNNDFKDAIVLNRVFSYYMDRHSDCSGVSSPFYGLVPKLIEHLRKDDLFSFFPKGDIAKVSGRLNQCSDIADGIFKSGLYSNFGRMIVCAYYLRTAELRNYSNNIASAIYNRKMAVPIVYIGYYVHNGTLRVSLRSKREGSFFSDGSINKCKSIDVNQMARGCKSIYKLSGGGHVNASGMSFTLPFSVPKKPTSASVMRLESFLMSELGLR